VLPNGIRLPIPVAACLIALHLCLQNKTKQKNKNCACYYLRAEDASSLVCGFNASCTYALRTAVVLPSVCCYVSTSVSDTMRTVAGGRADWRYSKESCYID
jgi:hypothetical protein